jgi:hypothetical protein
VGFRVSVRVCLGSLQTNIAGFVCPNCDKESQIFRVKEGGGAEVMAKEMGIPYLGKLPLDPRIARASDEGRSLLDETPLSIAAAAYIEVAKRVRDFCGEGERAAGGDGGGDGGEHAAGADRGVDGVSGMSIANSGKVGVLVSSGNSGDAMVVTPGLG